ncbi:MAG: hypothetical protein HGB05_18465 [Chloroflexi bacterium]|nr:hypothetical protein [Chloroflexota bacterium]
MTQKSDIDGERSELNEKIEKAQEDLKHAPQPADLATFEAFTAKIRAQLKSNIDPKPEKKRQLLQMLHVKVIISPKGEPEVTGWYTPDFSQMAKVP